MGRFAPIWFGVWWVCACESAAADPPPADDGGGTAAGSSSTGGTGSGTTFSAPVGCTNSGECAESMAPFCVAPYDPGSGTIEEGACVTECVAAGDLARACRDDESCCEGLVCNEVDGFCISESAESTTSTSSSGGDTDTPSTSGSSGPGTSSSGPGSTGGTSTGTDTQR